jgi:beta-lactamase regulating signal transducer with metallopeptidase domain
MIALWMFYAAALAGLFTAAAWGAEQALRLHGRPGRWVWGAALAASLLLPAGALAWRTAAGTAPGETVDSPAAPSPPSAGVLSGFDLSSVAPPAAFDRATPFLLAGWALLSAGALVFFALGVLHLSRRRRGWRRERVRDQPVRVSEGFGPAVVGVFRPEIVLPRWMLDMDAPALDLALRHEREHLERRDTLLLAAAFLAAAALPWNLALWAQLRRLRQSVELDCDLRVLASGASRKGYGALLLEVGGHAGRSRLAVAALSEPPSFLERRIGMITKRPIHGRAVRTLGALVLTGVLVALACDVAPPTVVVAPPPPSAQLEAVQAQAVGSDTIRVRGASSIDSQSGPPVIYIDGIRIMGESQAALSAIEPNDIERIQVTRGAEAALAFPDAPDAANGVIEIFMRRGRGEG